MYIHLYTHTYKHAHGVEIYNYTSHLKLPLQAKANAGMP